MNISEFILLDPENEFVGFFCRDHGESQRTVLESKYRFAEENKYVRPVVRKVKRRYLKRGKR